VTGRLPDPGEAEARDARRAAVTFRRGPIWTCSAAHDDTAENLVAGYERACAASREVASGFALDDRVPHSRLGQVSLRWIYVHMIEESARHVGHADILREQTDGATGFDG
jgi:Protein of unknown function (DUF664)